MCWVHVVICWLLSKLVEKKGWMEKPLSPSQRFWRYHQEQIGCHFVQQCKIKIGQDWFEGRGRWYEIRDEFSSKGRLLSPINWNHLSFIHVSSCSLIYTNIYLWGKNKVFDSLLKTNWIQGGWSEIENWIVCWITFTYFCFAHTIIIGNSHHHFYLWFGRGKFNFSTDGTHLLLLVALILLGDEKRSFPPIDNSSKNSPPCPIP